MTNATNVLFVCSRNKWRSPTGEDVIFVMEQKHKNRLKADYSRLLTHKPIHVLEIPDEYQYMDPELVEILKESVSNYLEL
jgi:predicted protein tyrosine phosphatase